MKEHGGQISPIKEEGNPERAAGPSSIGQSPGQHEVNPEHAAGPSSIRRSPFQHEVVLRHLTSRKGSIFRIPGLLKMRNEQAYAPYKFSIGPWHFGKTQSLRTEQKLKESILEGLMTRFSNPAAKRRQLEEAIKNAHGKARECYEGGDVYDEGENMDVSKEEFEKILLLDGCFIIELFRKNDGVVFSGGMMQVIYHDLLLLENQLPWFVLELLFVMTSDDLNGSNLDVIRGKLCELAIKFFRPVTFNYELKRSHNPDILHLRDFVHHPDIIHLVGFVWFYLSLSSETEGVGEELEYRTLIPSATRLKEAGVKFQKAELDVKFNEGVLEIPPLLITPSTETIIRNLIIFEQCRHSCLSRVTCYAILLDCLVETSNDVDLMSRAGILTSSLNPEETANSLNGVRDNIPIRKFFYAQLCKDVDRYCKRRWPRWRASLIQNCFTRPCAIFSVVLATTVLFFTVMQFSRSNFSNTS